MASRKPPFEEQLRRELMRFLPQIIADSVRAVVLIALFRICALVLITLGGEIWAKLVLHNVELIITVALLCAFGWRLVMRIIKSPDADEDLQQTENRAELENNIKDVEHEQKLREERPSVKHLEVASSTIEQVNGDRELNPATKEAPAISQSIPLQDGKSHVKPGETSHARGRGAGSK